MMNMNEVVDISINYYQNDYFITLLTQPKKFRIKTNKMVLWGVTNSISFDGYRNGFSDIYFDFDGATQCFINKSDIKDIYFTKMTKDDEKQFRRELDEFFRN